MAGAVTVALNRSKRREGISIPSIRFHFTLLNLSTKSASIYILLIKFDQEGSQGKNRISIGRKEGDSTLSTFQITEWRSSRYDRKKVMNKTM